jgi:phage FluMu protein Com
MGMPYKEYRCQNCQKLFFKGFLVEGEVEIKCRACHELSTIAASLNDKLLCMVEDCPNRIHLPNSSAAKASA